MHAFTQNSKKLISLFLLFSSACASVPRPAPLPSAHFDPAYQYEIKTADQKISNLSSAHIQRKDQTLIIKQADQEFFIPLSQVQKINGKSFDKKGSYAWQGALIGGAAGALTFGLGISLGGKCYGNEDCDDIKAGALVGISSLGAILGGGLGLGVGYLIPKKDKILINPHIDAQGNLGANVSFLREF